MVDPWWHPHLAFDPCCPPVLVTRRHTCSFVVYVEHNDKNNTTALVLNVNGCPPESKWQMVVSDPGLGSYTARDLADIGVAWRVVPDELLMAEARSVAARLAALPEQAVRSMKRVLNQTAQTSLDTALDLETEATITAFMDPLTTELVTKF